MTDNAANEVYHIAVVQFEGEDRAKQVVDLIKKQQRAGDYKVKAWAVVEVDDRGKTKVSQSGHGKIGAAAGAGTGALLGLIGGPAGLLAWALGGALFGGLAGKFGGQKFDAEQLKAIGATMQPNTSGIVVVIEDKAAAAMAAELGVHGGTLTTVTLGDQLSGEIATVEAVDLGEGEVSE